MLRRIGRFLLCLITGFFVWSFLLIIVYRDLPPPTTPLMLIRLLGGTGIDKDWVPISRISPNLIRAAMAGEDAKFCQHRGFDWGAIANAWRQYQRGRFILGASTISMQTAKNLFLWPGRSWWRKGLEVYFTALLELTWSKRRIMEAYLNIVEWGPGVYGAEAAARYHFHKSAADLTPEEAARLAAVLPNPRRWSASRPTGYILERAGVIRARMPEVPAGNPPPCGWPEVQASFWAQLPDVLKQLRH
jgi:monofunctional biosynthetic peptidoglycan transglycosylase